MFRVCSYGTYISTLMWACSYAFASPVMWICCSDNLCTYAILV